MVPGYVKGFLIFVPVEVFCVRDPLTWVELAEVMYDTLPPESILDTFQEYIPLVTEHIAGIL